jgi:hypothetical protein
MIPALPLADRLALRALQLRGDGALPIVRAARAHAEHQEQPGHRYLLSEVEQRLRLIGDGRGLNLDIRV